MTDIVERLRAIDPDDAHELYCEAAILQEAADEIERLRGLLQEFVDVNDDECRLDHHGYCQAHFLEDDCMVKRARAALEQK